MIDPRSNTMKRGDLKAELKNNLIDISAFILFTKDLLWDQARFLHDLNSKLLISDDISIILEKLKNIIFDYDNVVFLSNGSFEGIQRKITNYLENENS